MRHLSLEYIAGLVDGEGCIAITKGPSKSNKRGIRLDSRLTVAMTHKGIIELLANQLGVKPYRHRRGNVGHKDTYAVQLFGKRARDFAAQLKPYLIVKKEQAELLEQFSSKQSRKGSKGLTDQEWNERWDFYLKMKELNKRGVP